MAIEEILNNLEELKKKTIEHIKLEDCCMRMLYSCDYCINEINDGCVMQEDRDCIEKNFDDLKKLIKILI